MKLMDFLNGKVDGQDARTNRIMGRENASIKRAVIGWGAVILIVAIIVLGT